MKTFHAIILLLTIFNAMIIADDDQDTSSFSADGPVVIFDESITSHSIIVRDGRLVVNSETVLPGDTLTCFAGQSEKSFSFVLKEKQSYDSSEYKLPSRLFVVSDIEGNFSGFEMLLRGNGIIDGEYAWAFGDGQLVLVGDFFDRGLNVTECLWLIYKLESEAEQSGGKVHFILGNHEVMNMRDDLRYVRKKYMVNADSIGVPYEQWYSKNSELGRWLRSKNSVLKLGDYLFVHGGISPQMLTAGIQLDEINSGIRRILSEQDGKAYDSADSLLLRGNGPLWYRGIAKQDVADDSVKLILDFYGAPNMIIGHTVFDSISALYDGKVIAIDLDHVENFRNGFMNALLINEGEMSVTDHNGNPSALRPVKKD